MQVTNCNYQTSFEIKVMESVSDWEKLGKITHEYAAQSDKLESQEINARIQQIFADNCSILKKIQGLINTKKDPKMSKYWTEYTIVVAYDSKYSKVQAIGVIQPNYEFSFKKCSQLFYLATAYWNIDSTLTATEPYKVKGAGRSIVKLCSEMGKPFGSRGEVYLQSLDSAVDYYKDKLGFERVTSDMPYYSNVELYLTEEKAQEL